MKKQILPVVGIVALSGLFACGNNTDTNTTTTDSSSVTTGDTSNAMNNGATNNAANNNTAYSNAPLNAMDSTFVMKAAAGGMMEVDGGNMAQKNAQNDRVKAFGSMMVDDHSKANQELMSLAAAKGITLPSTLPPDQQKHLDQIGKLNGKNFDTHYMGMMVTDHKKDISDFEKAANSANDADVKAWAAKTLPVLKMHLDSAQAINGAIK